MSSDLLEKVTKFTVLNRFGGKGPLSVALVVTDKARSMKFPIDPIQLLSTQSAGQVAGLSSAAVQKVLLRNGIVRVLSQEGGRTSRGSIGNMKTYVRFLNELEIDGQLDLDQLEAFWVERVVAFFAGKPFKLKVDSSQGLRLVVRHILSQAQVRQKESTGTNYVGAVMQHLVGAKLDCALGPGTIGHHPFSSSDEQSGRVGDFLIGETAIHVTTAPSESLVRKCRKNLDAGLRPIVVTSQRGAITIDQLAESQAIADRIDVFEFEQFIALNIYELGKFRVDGNQIAIGEIIARYNQIVRTCETDPSLAIES